MRDNPRESVDGFSGFLTGFWNGFEDPAGGCYPNYKFSKRRRFAGLR